MSTSIGTYARAFQAQTNLALSAGHYDNSTAAKIAKGVVGILTLGIGYGVICLIEHFKNVRPKIDEYCDNAKIIANALSEAIEDNKQSVTVKLKDGQELTIQHYSGAVTLIDQKGQQEILVGLDFEQLHDKIQHDIRDNPGLYRTELPRELATTDPAHPLTLASIACMVTSETPHEHILLLRKAPHGDYLYLASAKEVENSERLQTRARLASELLGQVLGQRPDSGYVTAAQLLAQSKTKRPAASFYPPQDKPQFSGSSVCSTPSEVTMHWITALDRALPDVSDPQQRELITRLLQSQKGRWLAHEMTLGETAASLRADSKALRANGLSALSDLAYDEGHGQTSLASRLPKSTHNLPVTRLHDNIYGRYFESVLVSELVTNPPQDVLTAMQTVGTGMADMIDQLPEAEQKKLVGYLQGCINGDQRFWFNQVPGMDQLAKASWPQSKQLLSELLRGPITTGFKSIVIPYLSVKLFCGLSVTSLGKADWVRKINENYSSVMSVHRGRIDGPSNAVSAAAGITLRHQPAAVVDEWMTITDRPSLHCKPDLQNPTVPVLTALQSGAPFAGGISGSNNIMLGIIAHLRAQGRAIDPKSALLGSIMFLNYDGGHSLHEALWTANQFGPKLGLDLRASPNPRALFDEPISFISDYQSFVSMYRGTACEPVMAGAVSQAFERTMEHCETLTGRAVSLREAPSSSGGLVQGIELWPGVPL